MNYVLQTILAFFLFVFNVQAQTKPLVEKINKARAEAQVFQKIDVLKTTIKNTEAESEILKAAQYFQVDKTSMHSIVVQKPKHIEFSIPQETEHDMVLLLEEKNILTEDFTLVDSKDGKPVAYAGGAFYRGYIQGNPNSVVAISFFENEIIGLISTEKGNAILGKMGNTESSEHVLYWEADAKFSLDFDCGSIDTPLNPSERAFMSSGNAVETTNCVRMYLELEHDLVLEKGGVAQAVDFMTGVFNGVSTLYENDGINMTTSQIYAWSSPDSYATGSSTDALYDFKAKRSNYNGDLAHLVSRGAPAGGGVAFINGLCSGYGYGYSYIYGSYNQVPTYSWTVSVLAHEIGHNLGSRHTHACVWNGDNTAIDGCGQAAGYTEGCDGPMPANGGTIMSYCHLVSGVGINFSNGFGIQPQNLMQFNINTASCLSTCGGPVCTLEASVQASDIKCAGDTDGFAFATAFYGDGAYSYLWSNGSTLEALSGVGAGNYTVTITDGTGCEAVATAKILEPSALILALSSTNSSFAGAKDASISLQISGGTAPYAVEWSNGVTTQNQSDLAAGIYNVTVTDLNNCATAGTVEIKTSVCENSIVVFPYIETFENNEVGYDQDSNDELDWTFRKGRTPSNGTGPQAAFEGETYLYVEASGNSFNTASITSPCIDLRGRVQASVTFQYHMYGTQTGNLTVEVQSANGISNPIWSLSGDQGNAWRTAEIDLSSYNDQIIRLRLRATIGDGYRSDIAIDALTINSAPIPCDAPVFGFVPQHVGCAGEATGRIFLSHVLGGVEPYTLLWSNGESFDLISNLKAGDYSLIVTDAMGCSNEKEITISEPEPLTLSLESTFVSSEQEVDAQVFSEVSGGTMPYSYEWSTGAASAVLDGVAKGQYSLTVVDANTCLAEAKIEVQAKPEVNCNPIVAYPHEQGFEDDFGLWTTGLSNINNEEDDEDEETTEWIINSGSTPTNWTGPWAALEGSNYAYVEASGNRRKKAYLVSPCMTLAGAGTPLLTFNYHMYGSQMGSMSLQISTDGGETWSNNLWKKQGNQGNVWKPATVDLSDYANQTVRLRFSAKINRARSDMALDQIKISNDGSTNPIGPEGELFVDFANLKVQPNPAIDQAKLRFESRNETPYQIEIYDIAGRLVRQQGGTSLIGYSNVDLDLVDLAEGMYVILLRTENLTLTSKLTIQR